MAEVLQQLILDTLDSSSSIEDTRSLTLPGESGPAISQDAQITILGALNSLLSREVSHSLLLSQLYPEIA
jgi:phenylalanyl-tRNA synthetase alpha chain